MELGHKAVVPSDLELPADAKPRDVREAARKAQVELIVADRKTLDALLPRSGRPETFGRTLVYLHSGDPADAVRRLFERHKRLKPARLYTVTEAGVKASQLPTTAPTDTTDTSPSY